MALETGLCAIDGWQLDRTCMDIPAGTDEATIERWRKVAAELLYALTGNRFGPSCPVTVRPCRKQCLDGYGSIFGRLGFWPAGYNGSPWIPYVGRDGNMYNASLCGCNGDCHCGPELCEVFLPGPVFDVVSVTIGNQTVPAAEYGVLDGRYLVRRSDSPSTSPGDRCWPSCQDMSLPAGQPNTFAVTYRTGVALPALGTAALSALTAHYIRGCEGCGCGVGSRQNLSRLSRQGVELEFADPREVLADGRTGIEIADQFIHAYNPSGLTHASRVLSPDAPRRPRIWTT